MGVLSSLRTACKGADNSTLSYKPNPEYPVSLDTPAARANTIVFIVIDPHHPQNFRTYTTVLSPLYILVTTARWRWRRTRYYRRFGSPTAASEYDAQLSMRQYHVKRILKLGPEKHKIDEITSIVISASPQALIDCTQCQLRIVLVAPTVGYCRQGSGDVASNK
ncbi:hypothetical protein CBL_02306 [Carabus blaptoides fortunei]